MASVLTFYRFLRPLVPFVTGGLGLAQPALRLGVLGAFFFSAVCRPSKRSFLGSSCVSFFWEDEHIFYCKKR